MRSTQQFSVTLPNEKATLVRTTVASGEYASESEVAREGPRALSTRDRALDDWLSQRALPAYDAYRADSSRGLPQEEVRALIGTHGGVGPTAALTKGGPQRRPTADRDLSRRLHARGA